MYVSSDIFFFHLFLQITLKNIFNCMCNRWFCLLKTIMTRNLAKVREKPINSGIIGTAQSEFLLQIKSIRNKWSLLELLELLLQIPLVWFGLVPWFPFAEMSLSKWFTSKTSVFFYSSSSSFIRNYSLYHNYNVRYSCKKD